MADITRQLYIPDRRTGILQRISIPLIAGTDAVVISGCILRGVPQIYTLHRAMLSLTTSADVANRYIVVKKYSDALEDLGGILRGAITASTTGATLSLFPINSVSTAAYTAGAAGLLMDESFLIQGYDNVKFYISSGQAADVWSLIAEFKYLNRQYGLAEVLPETKLDIGEDFK